MSQPHRFPFKDEAAIQALRDDYERDGFVIVDGIFASPDEMESLKAAAADVVKLTRDGGVQHLMSPSLPHSALFTAFYGSRVLEISSALLAVPVQSMHMELFNLLINPTHHAFALGWRTDDIKPSISTEEEERILVADKARAGAAKDGGGIQWNAALYDDAYLFRVHIGGYGRSRNEWRMRHLRRPRLPFRKAGNSVR
ncbi:hypothetical protein A4X13_0g7952 [Tilletia indica]|uniref:Uncharacterized protein n=1 Tax=Tilletia indica TaxID=43049 RepID=A0A8T8SGN6_9BASI|nr:hypothetical protein A4X13_0g7952 [Tilletia indica]